MRRALQLSVVHFAATTAVTVRLCSSDAPKAGNNRATMQFGIDPAKLELKLDFGKMDFSAMIDSTEEAIAHDKKGGYATSNDRFLDNKLAATATELSEDGAADSPVVAGVYANSAKERVSAFGRSSSPVERTIRGVVGAGAVHDANTPAAAYAQRRLEYEAGGGQRMRYTLMDTLKDAALAGNWNKAYDMFKTATLTACKGVIIPSSSSTQFTSISSSVGTDLGQSEEQVSLTLGSERVNECLAALRSQNSSLPPAGLTSPQRTKTFRKDFTGIMRWNNGHFYMLIKVLLETGHFTELATVWDVMTRIGFVDFHIDARTVNSIMGLMRHSAQQAQVRQQLVNPPSMAQTNQDSGAALGREKVVKRQIIADLQEIASRKRMRLSGSNQRTVEAARIADALQGTEGGSGEAAAGGERAGSGEGREKLRVGDFNGLLRVAQSDESTKRVIGMMDKLNVPLVASTYASIITSLHNPRYRVAGATEKELPLVATSQSADAKEGNSEEGGTAVHRPASTEESKDHYEAYKSRRIEAARGWFDQCPAGQRNADLYNAMLYLLRARAHTGDFDALLSECRGAAVRIPEEVAKVEARTAAEEAAKSAAKESSKARAADPRGSSEPLIATPIDLPEVPPIQSAQWKVRPNGRIFELLVNRARYLHDWQAMWGLYAEMRDLQVRGTRELYQTFLDEAKRHPPVELARSSDVSAFVMAIYDEMRNNGADVYSVNSTVNLVNAWSSTRSTRRWQ